MIASFSKGISRDEAIANIIPGKILYLSVRFPHKIISEEKYFIVVGFDKRPLLLKINSQCKFLKSYIVMRQTIYPFLDYDSYLDCSMVWYMLTAEDVIIQLMSNPERRIIGEIIKDHARVIVERTNVSKSIIPLHKRIIADAFKA